MKQYKKQKYTPTDCFFGDFTHWVLHSLILETSSK